MPTIIYCPSCGRKLNAPDQVLGKQVRCPQCKVSFTASPPPPEAVTSQVSQAAGGNRGVPSGEPFDAPQSGHSDRAQERGWRTVRTGLVFILIGTVAHAAPYIVSLLCCMALKVLPPREAESFFIVRSAAFYVLQLAAVAVGGLGYLFCMSVPPRSGVRGLAIAAFGLTIVGWLFSCGNGLFSLIAEYNFSETNALSDLEPWAGIGASCS